MVCSREKASVVEQREQRRVVWNGAGELAGGQTMLRTGF